MSTDDMIHSECQEFIFELKIFEEHCKVLLERNLLLRDQIEKEVERLTSEVDPEHSTSEDIWFQAIKNILGSDSWFGPDAQKCALIGSYSIIIFHSFERFLALIFHRFLEMNLKSFLKKPTTEDQKKRIEKVLDSGLETFSEFANLYPEIKKFNCYPKLQELNFVCNVFKHGNGKSKDMLKKIRPEFFLFDDKPIRPLAGWDVLIETDDLNRYLEAIKAFLGEAFNFKLII